MSNFGSSDLKKSRTINSAGSNGSKLYIKSADDNKSMLGQRMNLNAIDTNEFKNIH